MICAKTLSEYQRVMLWRLIIKEFGPNIQHISGVENIVSDMISRFPYTSVHKYNPSKSKAQCSANNLFTIDREENNEGCFLLILLNFQREQQKNLRKINSKLSAYISDQGSSYSKQALDKVEIICYNIKVYVPQTLLICVLDW